MKRLQSVRQSWCIEVPEQASSEDMSDGVLV